MFKKGDSVRHRWPETVRADPALSGNYPDPNGIYTVRRVEVVAGEERVFVATDDAYLSAHWWEKVN